MKEETQTFKYVQNPGFRDEQSGTVRCGLESCCGRYDCLNFQAVKDAGGTLLKIPVQHEGNH